MPHYKIHPAIGIARVGSSAGFELGTNYFIGPEIPGISALPSDAKFRDAHGALKRQGARFRVFEYDDAGHPTREVLVGDNIAAIEWTVHVANKKPFWYEFAGLRGEQGYAADHRFRNGQNLTAEERKKRYQIDPGPRTLKGVAEIKEFSQGTSMNFEERWPGQLQNGSPVEIKTLGAALTDAEGRLVVLGGLGISGTLGAVAINGFANNPGWFDDVSDGPVSAVIRFIDGSSAAVEGAWVITGPPDFAPQVENIVSMYDLLVDLGIRQFSTRPDIFTGGHFLGGYEPSFSHDVYPMLRRAIEFGNVVKLAAKSHRSFMTPQAINALSTKPFAAVAGMPQLPSPADIFDKMRAPDDWQSNHHDDLMPRLLGDQDQGTALTLTRTQYHILKQWSQGRFNADWNGPPASGDTITPTGLDRAALEACVGGAFYPGIEAGWIMRRPSIYANPFSLRFKPAIPDEFDFNGLTPGSITMRSALPWQADFYKCSTEWWPAQRPNEVLVAANQYKAWDRTLDQIGAHLGMVRVWDQLGLVVRDPQGNFRESERRLHEPVIV